MNTRKLFFIGVPLILVIIVSIYYAMGGFNVPQIKIANAPAYLVLGKRYKGKIEDKMLKKTYQDAQQKYKEEILKGTFCVVHFHEPDEKNGDVDAIIGVIATDSSASKPKGYGFYKIEKRKIVKATLNSHYSVAPSPETVNEMMQQVAKQNGFALGKGSLEKYYDIQNWIVEIPVVKL